MGFIACEGVVLGEQHFLDMGVPSAVPVFVGLAEAKREIGLA